MQINVVPHRKSTGRARLEPCALELFRTPLLDALDLRLIEQVSVSCRHNVLSRRLTSLFGQTSKPDVPIEGDIQISQSLYPAEETALIRLSCARASASACSRVSLNPFTFSEAVTFPCRQAIT